MPVFIVFKFYCSLNVIATSVSSFGESGGINLMNCQSAATMSEHSLNFAVSTGNRHQNCKQKEQVKVTECQFNY